MHKLLQINVVANWGSTGKIAEEIGLTAIKEGWDSYIAYGRNVRPSKSKLVKIGTYFDIKWHGLITRLFDKHGLSSKKATRVLIQQIEIIKPSIIHLHNIHGYYINYQLLFEYLSNTNIPIVWTLHDCWVMTGHCSHFEIIKCNKWKNECYKCPQKNKYPESLLFDRSKKNYRDKKVSFNSVNNLTFVAVSEWIEGLLKESFVSSYPSHIIHNGINTEIFKPSNNKSIIINKINTNGTFIIIGVSGIWNENKGLYDFYKLSMYLDDDTRIILVGLNKKQINSLPPRIIGIERTENINELSELYSCADLFINPTYSDTFPTTNLEALSCGTPVVTYRTGGSIEAITAETGFIVEQGCIDGLIEAINIVKKNGKTYYSEACRKRAIDFFRKEDKFREYINLYKSLIQK